MKIYSSHPFTFSYAKPATSMLTFFSRLAVILPVRLSSSLVGLLVARHGLLSRDIYSLIVTCIPALNQLLFFFLGCGVALNFCLLVDDL
jgi:hypothetical protein